MDRSIIRVGQVQQAILLIRGQRVMLDADLANLYGVPTKRLNEQVKRNANRFPADFMFQLTAEEKAEVVAKCDHLHRLKFSPSLPHAFTEHGAIMLASVLNSPRAVRASIYVVRAFVRLRELLSSQKELARKLSDLESRIAKHDTDIRTIVKAIRELMEPPANPERKIGFRIGEPRVRYGPERTAR